MVGSPALSRAMRSPVLAVHTKAVVEALGPRGALRALEESGVGSVVAWTGEDGRHLGFLPLARRAGMRVLAAALPRYAGPPDGLHGWARGWRAQAGRVLEDCPLSLMIAGSFTGPGEGEALADQLRRTGAPLVLENSARRVDACSRPGFLADLVDRVPGARIALDLGHAALAEGGSLPEDLGERLAWVELHDNDGRTDGHLPLGQGRGRGRVLHRLRDLGRPVAGGLPLVIETDARCGTDHAAWTAALEADRRAVAGAWTEQRQLV